MSNPSKMILMIGFIPLSWPLCLTAGAMVQATLLLACQLGAKIEVFLTDGSDNSSRCALPVPKKMNGPEGFLSTVSVWAGWTKRNWESW